MKEISVDVLHLDKPLICLKTGGVYAPPHKQIDVLNCKTQLFKYANCAPFKTVGLQGRRVKPKTLRHQSHCLRQRRAGRALLRPKNMGVIAPFRQVQIPT